MTQIWLWDGSDVVAQCGYNSPSTRCGGYGFPVEGLGSYSPATGYLVVNDRSLAGQIVSRHDADGFSGMKPTGRNSRNYFLGGINASAAPGSVSADTNTGPDTHGPLQGTKVALDGWTPDNNTWQGVRTYDASVGQWTTPDAYAGDVRDPMSQKPFMWNKNNPYEFADPSGYDVIIMVDKNSARPFGHISMVVYNPQTMTGTFDQSGPEKVGSVIGAKEVITSTHISDVRTLAAYHQDAFHIDSSAAQDAKMDKYWADSATAAAAGEKYNAFTNSCEDKIANALNSAGIPPNQFTGIPTLDGALMDRSGMRIDPSALKPIASKKKVGSHVRSIGDSAMYLRDCFRVRNRRYLYARNVVAADLFGPGRHGAGCFGSVSGTERCLDTAIAVDGVCCCRNRAHSRVGGRPYGRLLCEQGLLQHDTGRNSPWFCLSLSDDLNAVSILSVVRVTS